MILNLLPTGFDTTYTYVGFMHKRVKLSSCPHSSFLISFSGKPSTIYDKNNPDWAPSQNLGYDFRGVSVTSRARYERTQGRSEKRRRSECASALLDLSCHQPSDEIEDVDEDLSLIEDSTVKDCQTDITGDYITGLEKENTSLKEKLKMSSLNEDSFKGDNEKVLFYTGLPKWSLLLCLFDFLKNSSPELKSSRGILSPFQKVLLGLIRMRLNLSGRDLGYRFGGISEATVSRTFLHVVDALYHRLKPLIIWPDRDVLRKTLPMDFRKHCPNCVVIIDCFEIFLDRPFNPLARAQTFSSYKHHNTVKYLIGITPQGTVSFISEGWGGRVSDKHLTENSGLLDHLTPGDVILADRGFDIQESVGLFCSTIKIPAFTKGKKQLSGIEVEQTRRIANVRIHVERVIGNIRKKYSILSATQPIDFVTVRNGDAITLDKIVTTCCALVNMCDSVVPFD